MSLTSPLSGRSTSLHSSPTAIGNRPQSDRADDMLPKGTIYRWNPYVLTPTSNTHAGGGHGAAGGGGGDGPSGVTPGGALTPGGNSSGPNAQRNKQLQARGAPFDVLTPRAEGAAADCLSTPLADDAAAAPRGGTGAPGSMSPGGGGYSGFVGVAAATVDAETGEPLPRRVIELTPGVAGGPTMASDSSDAIERTLVALIEEQRDSEVRSRVLALPQREANMLYSYLVRTTVVSEFLCFKQRGKIFADVIEAAAEALDNADLFRWMHAHLDRFVHDQSGCIAVTRVYDVIPAALRATIDDFVALNFVQLATHAFGNYAVQRVIQAADPDIIGSMARQLRSRGVIASLTTSKAGSHVVERFVSKVPLRDALPVCRVLLTSDPLLVTSLANDRYGNYVLQASLRKVFDTRKALLAATTEGAPAAQAGGDAEATSMPEDQKQDVLALAETCLADIPPLVLGSSNSANVHRAMGVKVAKDGAAQPAGAAAPNSNRNAGGGAASTAGGSAAGVAGAAQAASGGQPKGPRLSASSLRRGLGRR